MLMSQEFNFLLHSHTFENKQSKWCSGKIVKWLKFFRLHKFVKLCSYKSKIKVDFQNMLHLFITQKKKKANSKTFGFRAYTGFLQGIMLQGYLLQ